MNSYELDGYATSVLMFAIAVGLLTASGCGIAWQLKEEKIKPCPVEESGYVKTEIERLQKELDAFRRKL